MSRASRIAVLLLIGLLVLTAGGYAWWRSVVAAADRDSRAFVEAAVPAIVGSWDVTELEARASPQFFEAQAEVALPRLFLDFARLGKVVSFDGTVGDASVGTDGLQLRREGYYVTTIQFENGRAEISLKVVRRAQTWQIDSFRIDAPQLTHD